MKLPESDIISYRSLAPGEGISGAGRPLGKWRGLSRRDLAPESVARFEAKFARGEADQCWDWLAGRFRTGYGMFFVATLEDGRRHVDYAHRIAFVLAGGEIPAGVPHAIMHSCDRPQCVNPAHLSYGTAKDNQRDAMSKGRHTHQVLGRRRAPIREAALVACLTRPAKQVAQEFGVHIETLYRWRRAAGFRYGKAA